MIICDEKICVKCLACVTESEFGGVIYEHDKIFFDDTRPEDWENIFAICPVGAIKSNGECKLARMRYCIQLNCPATARQSKVVAAQKNRLSKQPITFQS